MLQSTAIGSPQSAGFGVEGRARFAAPASSGAANGSVGQVSAEPSSSPSTSQLGQLTPEEQQQLLQLQQIDRQVRAHEQAHLAVGAELVRGGASFTYQIGPDDRRYAVGGEVSIDASPAATPQDTIPKARHIRAAALAPADPSAQDQSVAAQADRLESAARMALAEQSRDAASGAEQGRARFYPGSAQADGERRPIGARLDLFA